MPRAILGLQSWFLPRGVQHTVTKKMSSSGVANAVGHAVAFCAAGLAARPAVAPYQLRL